MLKKNFFITVLIGVFFSCAKSAPKDYAILSGKIKNAQTKQITIKSRHGDFKDIKLNKDGSFTDTLHLKNKGQLLVFSSKESGQVFLKNNDDLYLKVDAKQFKETLLFSGKGAETSNYLAKKSVLQSKIAVLDLFKLDKKTFNIKVKEITTAFEELLNNYITIDSTFYLEEQKKIKTLPKMLENQYGQFQTQQ